jgi:hypothetical protein
MNFNQLAMSKLIDILRERFIKNMHRHPEVIFNQIANKITSNITLLNQLNWMEETGGEPDVMLFEESIIYIDFSKESPINRRSYCYDQEALEKRKENKPSGSALQIAQNNGLHLINENQYFALQQLGDFDLKTSSWLLTPADIRTKGGAIFGDKRYGRTFIYHNGAESYYAARGFRVYTLLK